MLATIVIETSTIVEVAEFKKLQTFKGITNVLANGEVTVRYYCNNYSGETVCMLQEQVKAIPDIYQTKQIMLKTELEEDWVSGSGSSGSLNSVAYGNGKFVAVCTNGATYYLEYIKEQRNLEDVINELYKLLA